MDPIVADAHAHLRDHLEGLILFDGESRPIRIVVAPDGRLVASVMVAMLTAADVVLALPDEDEDSMQLMVSLEPLDEHGPEGGLADRWRIHHGDPPDVRWAAMTIDAARFGGYFLDGEAFDLANPLVEEEASVCGEINADPDAVRAIAIAEARRRGRPPADWGLESPRVVGVDPHGFDVRGSYGVLRVPVTPSMKDAAQVRERFAAVRAEASESA